MSLLEDYFRVSMHHPCPVCRHADWCLLDREHPEDPRTVLCSRVESRHRWGDAGWLHRLRDDGFAVQPRRTAAPRRGHHTRFITNRPPRRADLSEIACIAVANTVGHLDRLASTLGVSVSSLLRLGVGRGRAAWSFPMHDATGEIVGIRLRADNGRRFSVRGGREGLFLPAGIPDNISDREPLFLPEGPTDTAALLDLGLVAIGRPNNRNGREHLRELLRRRRPASVIIFADNDSPGISGATDIAKYLLPHALHVAVLRPPDSYGDARDWVRGGATRRDVLEAASPASALASTYSLEVANDR